MLQPHVVAPERHTHFLPSRVIWSLLLLLLLLLPFFNTNTDKDKGINEELKSSNHAYGRRW